MFCFRITYCAQRLRRVRMSYGYIFICYRYFYNIQFFTINSRFISFGRDEWNCSDPKVHWKSHRLRGSSYIENHLEFRLYLPGVENTKASYRRTALRSSESDRITDKHTPNDAHRCWIETQSSRKNRITSERHKLGDGGTYRTRAIGCTATETNKIKYEFACGVARTRRKTI